MSQEKAQRYHRIAQACLKALNAYTQGNDNPQQAVQAAHDAIDQAFTQENLLLLNELNAYREALELIAEAPDSVSKAELTQMAQTVLGPSKAH